MTAITGVKCDYSHQITNNSDYSHIYFVRNRCDYSHMKHLRADLVTVRLLRLLKEERKRQGISHQTLADAAGVNRSTVSLIEAGKRTPTITLCLKLTWALGLDFATLVENAQKE